MTAALTPLLPVLLAALLLSLLTAFWLLWPLRGRVATDATAMALQTRVYRERLQELNADLMAGRLDTDTYAGLKIELDRNLLADQQAVAAPVRASRVRALALAVLIGLPAVSSTLYLTRFLDAGVAPERANDLALRETITRVLAGQEPTADGARHSLQDFVRALQRRVQAEPGNADAWLTLGLGFLQARDLDPAKVALARAMELRPGDTQVVMTYVQAAIMGQGSGPMDPVARQALTRVLQQDPDHQGALLMLALGSLRAGEQAQALEALDQLQRLRQRQPDGDQAADARIAGLVSEALGRAAPGRAAQAGTVSRRGTSAQAPVTTGRALQVEVSVDQALARRIPPEATLFVFARSPAGPPMPVAVVRRPAQGFPLRLTLSDADSLQPDRLLSAQGDLVLQARVSRTGNATPAPGDWEAAAVPVQAGNTGLIRLRLSETR